MEVYRSANGLVVHAPAKLNLFFEILAKRDDGFHEIESLMVPVSLYDTLLFVEDLSGRVELDCQRAAGSWGSNDSGLSCLPEGRANLAVKAVELLQQHASVSRGGWMRLVKRIPIAAGLGGGSSDAAAALVAANECWGLGWSRSDLALLGAELGSDVPFFLGQGAAVCRGRGEVVDPIESLGALHFVLVRPPAGLSTSDVYDVCQVAEEPLLVEPVVDAFKKGDLSRAGKGLFNRLQSAAESLSPWIRRVEDKFVDLDCLGHMMSGSGTCYFGLCRHWRHAGRVARRLQASGVGAVFALIASR